VSRILSSMTSVTPSTRIICMYAMVYRANSTAGAIGDVPVALDFDLDFEYEDV